MKSKIWVEIIISNFDMSYKDLSKLIGVQPTEGENAGDLYKSPSGKEFILGLSSWTLESMLAPYAPIEEQIKDILNRIKNKDGLKEVSKKYPLTLNIVIHMSDLSPFIGWSNDIMHELAKYNFSWGLDISVEK
ncbi:MAG: DUF4279 domain-containing protein [Ignavibacteria bacterium]